MREHADPLEAQVLELRALQEQALLRSAEAEAVMGTTRLQNQIDEITAVSSVNSIGIGSKDVDVGPEAEVVASQVVPKLLHQ